MSGTLSPADFPAFYRAVHGSDPFPWQARLARQVCEGGWPSVLSLPTACGKTSCIDVAVFALAQQRGCAPRRIFMAVDRRLIVDQAFEHASAIERALGRALAEPSEDGDRRVLRQVAAILAELAVGSSGLPGGPLSVTRLRGGLRDEALWCRSPLQPTVVCSTVDQVGSRLLFRGYGVSERAWPIHAGLVGCDSLIILDEAHCSEPFRQTLSAVRSIQSDEQEALPGLRPLQVVEMSATPRHAAAAFVLDESDRAHSGLKSRLGASKPIELRTVAGKLAGAADGVDASDAIADEAVRLVKQFLDGGNACRIGVVVNRVQRARRAAALLHSELGERVDVRLLVGAMRPLDRDGLESELRARVGSRSDATESRPIIVVATQCIEVGADFDFDAMISEAAALDALRQRFGRLNRLGRFPRTVGALLMPKLRAEKGPDKAPVDPIYQTADVSCWNLLESIATTREVVQGKRRTVLQEVDFGTDALDAALSAHTDGLSACMTASEPAPRLLPAHAELLLQTSPPPSVEPDVALFLHGMKPAEPEISICVRADLPVAAEESEASDDEALLRSYITDLPPSPSECIQVRRSVGERWLRGIAADDADISIGEDLEAEPIDRRDSRTAPGEYGTVLLLRARTGEVERIKGPARLAAGDILVIGLRDGGRDGAATLPESVAQLPCILTSAAWASPDCADLAWSRDRGESRVRLDFASLKALAASASVPLPAGLTAESVAQWNECEPEEWRAALGSWLDEVDQCQATPAGQTTAATALANALALVRGAVAEDGETVVESHPSGGIILRRIDRLARTPKHALALPTETGAGATGLEAHCAAVGVVAETLANALALPAEVVSALRAAGEWHDLGKADARFQSMLRGGVGFGPLLAKSGDGGARARRAFASSDWPRGARHEGLSLRALECDARLSELATDLVLHLVATHHGCARPFLPPFDGPMEDFSATLHGVEVEVPAAAAPFPDARIANRFWRVVGRFGPWQTAFLEAILRIADARQSEAEESLRGTRAGPATIASVRGEGAS
jgi:CRISPR-associated endonuclease/helicase Cas3